MAIQLEDGEILLKEGPANHFKGMEAVGGKLHLTNRRLLFQSHSFNVQTHEETYLLADIASVRTRNTLGIVPNGIGVMLNNNHEERFVVNGRQEWIQKILWARANNAQQ